MLISKALTGCLKSKFSRTVGCNIPKVPMTLSFPSIRKCTEAAWPGK